MKVRPSRFALVFLLAVAVLCQGQQSKIVIRLLNGETGKPIPDKSFNVWLGDGGMLLLNTDRKGEISLDVSNVQPREVRINPSTRFDCRSRHDFSAGYRIKYSLDEVASRGVVSENLCGNPSAPPEPGVLILFVRPRTFIEGMKI
jgi:hypothetical protein